MVGNRASIRNTILGAVVVALATSQGSPSGHADSTSPPIKPHPRRFKAPELVGGVGWVNSKPIELRQLRGKFVVLDFWTYCCINCLHVLPELKKLERKYAEHVTVIGVHSGKFAAERNTENIREAIARHEIDHAVVNDAELRIAKAFGVSAWPTFRIIDPEGYVVASHVGEAKFEQFETFFRRAIAAYQKKGVLAERTAAVGFVETKGSTTKPLRFPGKVLADAASQRLFIADSGHNRIVIATLDGKLTDTIGNGEAGRGDGSFDRAEFHHPQGMALGDNLLYVADTGNHLLRAIDLKSKTVETLAGSGEQARNPSMRMAAVTRPLSSPWDLCLVDGDLYVAMAGTHQIWKMMLDRRRIGPFAGNSVEDIIDGPLLPRARGQLGFASFAQPSGLATDGEFLFVADSEGSSIRAVPLRRGGLVQTIVGTSRLPANRLFTYGDRDGPAAQSLFQHPLGVAYHEGTVFVADTYNNKIKQIRLADAVVQTISGGNTESNRNALRLNEPAGISYADGKLFVADTNNHRIVVLDLGRDNELLELKIRGLSGPAPAQ